MKIRTDFVSNSSSSSFIIRDTADFFSTFNITKSDVEDVIYTLYFGKDYKTFFVNQVNEARKRIENEIKTATEKKDAFNIKFYKDRLKELNRDPISYVSGIYIYDMLNEIDFKKCRKENKELFKSWDAPNEGSKAYEMFKDSLDALGIHIYSDNDISDTYHFWDKYDVNHKGKTSPIIKKAISEIRKISGIKTMYDVAFNVEPLSRYVFHFDDNVVWECSAMCEPKNGPSKYETQDYTTNRFYEVLVKELLKKKRIDLNDPKYIEFKNWWKVPEDHWWKDERYRKHHKKDYFTRAEDDSLTWYDIVKDSFRENSIGHEG